MPGSSAPFLHSLGVKALHKEIHLAKTIAIVEDDPDQRSNYSDAITKKGYEVRAYGSRQEALEGFDEELPDLAILDIILGEEVDAGFQLCRDLSCLQPHAPGSSCRRRGWKGRGS